MGCDIHMHVEVWDKRFNCWREAGPFLSYNYYGRPGRHVADVIYYERNYTLFQILNPDCGRGWDRFPPIQPHGRGIPQDVSLSVGQAYTAWGRDAHSASYYTLAELLAYNWKGSVDGLEGYVDAYNYFIYKETGSPHYSTDKNAVPVSRTTISPEEMQSKIDEVILTLPKGEKNNKAAIHRFLNMGALASYMTLITWNEPISEHTKEFQQVIQKLQKLGQASDVRIVFWFDN